MDNHENPLVSVLIPSYNQGRYIAETLNSILAQDYRPIEILVMDGASTDSTLSVLEGFRHHPEVRIFSEPDKGVVDAVNKGLAKASGTILGIQSSDDIYAPGAIQAAVRCMQSNPDVGLVYGDVEYIDEHSRVQGREHLRAFDLAEYLGRLTYIPQPAAFFRATTARSTGLWNPEISYVADADYWMRIALTQRVVKLDHLMGRYRYHDEQRDKYSDRILRDWERMVGLLLAHQSMTPALSRSARSGVHLARYRYTPAKQWLRRTIHLYRAALQTPSLLGNQHFPTKELLPGRVPIWAFLSRLKRRLYGRSARI
jgi:glycosyltransferase involved in cell wall biosynthesis